MFWISCINWPDSDLHSATLLFLLFILVIMVMTYLKRFFDIEGNKFSVICAAIFTISKGIKFSELSVIISLIVEVYLI